jgi:hypothetical protein
MTDPNRTAADDDEARRHALYLEERKGLQSGSLEASKALYANTVAVSAGALVLSVTFLEKLAPEPCALPLIGISWLFFSATILIVGVALYLDERSFREQALILDDAYSGTAERPNRFVAPALWTSRCVLYSLAAGLLSLASFAYINVAAGRSAMPNSDRPIRKAPPLPTPRPVRPSPQPPTPLPNPRPSPAPSPFPSPMPWTPTRKVGVRPTASAVTLQPNAVVVSLCHRNRSFQVATGV